MKSPRRIFLKVSGLAGLGIAGGGLMPAMASSISDADDVGSDVGQNSYALQDESQLSIIGQYGQWAASLNEGKLPSLSFRNDEFSDLEQWRAAAKKRLTERLAIPDIGGVPRVTVGSKYTFDGLQIEELSWQLPYGRPTEGVLLKPADATQPLPGILAFHDHGGNKYFGTRKIIRTSGQQHPLMASHQQQYYENFAWANEMAKRGYVVLVADAFAFGSRRVMMQDVPAHMRGKLTDDDPENPENIKTYNAWASQHEHVMARSLFSAGTTWPGVFFAEDRKALDVLSARTDVDENRIGCGGLSGGGLRTVLMGGLDPRIKCAVCVGFMSTWKDFLLHKSYTHTWMTYVPLVPNELEFPEVLGLRVPLPTLVLNDSEDQLYTLPEMQAADAILAEIYTKANATGNYKCSYYPGPHKFDAAMQTEAFNWFDKWLKS